MEKTDKNIKCADFVVSEDHSLLIKPIMMKSSTVHNIVSFVRNGTPEVRDLLINECEMIFECKVCRSLHRSLANFLAHKRVYCKEHCCESMTLFEQTEIEDETVIVNPESPDDEAANEKEKLDAEVDENDGASLSDNAEVGVSVPKIFRLDPSFHGTQQQLIPSSSSEVHDGCGDAVDKKPKHLYDDVINHLNVRKDRRSETVVNMTEIDGNKNAVYQSITVSNKARKVVEESAEEPMERDESMEREIKVEMPQLKMAPQVANRSAAKPLKGGGLFNNTLISVPCIKCRTLFTSIKTLTRHLKSVHGKNRIYFNCLFCSSKFSESWSVVRHILTVHKKSKSQVDKLRKKICQKAFQNILDDRDSSDADSDVAEQSEDAAVTVSSDTSQSKLLPTVVLQKNISHLKCRHCRKIFTRSDSLKSHEKSCSSNVERELDQKKAADASNGRPKRVVKRKEVSDFVPSRVLHVPRDPTSTKQKKRESSIVAVTAMDVIDAKTLECNRCLQKFSSMSNARRHAAMHIGWNRFKCKHCDYQSYNRSSCCYHIKRVHSTRRLLQGQVDKYIEPLPTSSASTDKPKDGEQSDLSEELVLFTRPNSSASNCAEQKSFSEGKKSQSAKRGSEAEQSQNGNKANAGRSDSSPPTLVGKATPSSTSFNISTRRHPRFFDISPYRREDQSRTLVTRSSSYVKPEPDFEAPKKPPPSRRKANVKRPEKVVTVVPVANGATDEETTSTDDDDDGTLSEA